jgi:UDP-N-acetylglucosamine 3-dehydrogenase
MSFLKRKIKTAVIGVGNMGRYHARVYSQLKNASLVAVSDINEKIGKKVAKEFNCRYYKDYNKMLDKENIDAVSIAVPTKLHKKVALDVIKSKTHLLIEKPIALTTTEAQEIIKAAKKAKVKLTVGHIERFNPAIKALKDIIKKGDLGKITSIIAKRVGMFPPQIKDANVIIDLAVHDIDIFNYLLEKQPVEVFAKGRSALTNHREDSAEIFLSYDETSGFIQVNWITPVKIRTLSVTGSKGYAELNYITQKLELYQSRYKKRVDNFGEFVIKFGEPIKKEIKINKKEPLLCELKSFIECIRMDKEPQVTGEDGLRALMIAEQAIESLICNKVIKRSEI